MSFKETELGKIPLYWDVAKLGDVADVLSGFAFKSKDFVDNGVPVIKIKNIVPPYVTTDDSVYVSQELYELSEKYQLNYNDILISMTGSNYNQLSSAVGKVGRVRLKDEPMLLNQRVGKILTNEKKCNKEFLYYNISTMETRYRLALSAGGSANQANVSPKQIKSLLIPYPPLEEQKVIAHILSTLDEKFEVNNQINKVLENMAQAIFKQWFVDFEFPNEDGEPYKSSGGDMIESELGMIPKGWEVKVLGEIIDIIKQGTKPGEHLKDRKYNPIDTLPMKSIAINDFKPYEEAKSSLILFEKYDILIGAMRVYFHRVNLAPYKGITRTTTFVLRSKRIQDVPYNLFLLNMDETIDYAERTSKGSTMPYAVWDNGMSNILVAYSNQELRNKFFQIIQPMLETIMKKSAENEVLIKLRDSLLPKLMSGEIRVPLDEEGDVS